ncbi:hypothetical protein FN846DRAFT_894833 [Sphaerosporella brunnea]|uniref:Uncharacterized protein n=1 Tax=Sphaerosporella brunnea TaxID=1250544 RepID=A0A5J5EG86_9PEZI|nr:hypothetical protein FN846DRAFT_894833 [Sphaerosporella brunnea]
MARHKAPAITHPRDAIRKHNILHPPPSKATSAPNKRCAKPNPAACATEESTETPDSSARMDIATPQAVQAPEQPAVEDAGNKTATAGGEPFTATPLPATEIPAVGFTNGDPTQTGSSNQIATKAVPQLSSPCTGSLTFRGGNTLSAAPKPTDSIPAAAPATGTRKRSTNMVEPPPAKRKRGRPPKAVAEHGRCLLSAVREVPADVGADGAAAVTQPANVSDEITPNDHTQLKLAGIPSAAPASALGGAAKKKRGRPAKVTLTAPTHQSPANAEAAAPRRNPGRQSKPAHTSTPTASPSSSNEHAPQPDRRSLIVVLKHPSIVDDAQPDRLSLIAVLKLPSIVDAVACDVSGTVVEATAAATSNITAEATAAPQPPNGNIATQAPGRKRGRTRKAHALK